MLYREIIALCSEIHTKHINTVCGQNVELLNVKLAVHIVTTGLQCVKATTNAPNHDQYHYPALLNTVIHKQCNYKHYLYQHFHINLSMSS